MLCVPLKAKDKLVGVAQVINKKIHPEDLSGEGVFDEEDLKLFTLFAAQAAIAIDNAQLHANMIKQERLSWDLEMAKEIQKSLLPQRSADVPGIQLTGYYDAAYQVGGDIFDYFPMGRNHYGLCIGDVSGKGVSAALYMARFLSDLRSLALQQRDPSYIVERLNRFQYERSRMGMFITLIFAVLDLETFTLDYVRACHLPLILSRNGQPGELVMQECDSPIGIFENSVFQVNTVKLEPGDCLLWYTDGITEVRNQDKEMNGTDWLLPLVCRQTLPVEAMARSIVDEAHRFGGQNPYDDITLMVLRRDA